MEATPFEHVEDVAEATYCTGEVTVAPLLGLVTETLASAWVVIATIVSRTHRKRIVVLPHRQRGTRSKRSWGQSPARPRIEWTCPIGVEDRVFRMLRETLGTWHGVDEWQPDFRGAGQAHAHPMRGNSEAHLV
jgi:hypothetical protein